MGNFSYFQGSPAIVSAAGPSGPGTTTFSITPGSNISLVSLGFQNEGFNVDFYASQMFISTGGTGWIQVVNTSASQITATPWAVQASSSGAAAVSGAKSTVKVTKGSKKK